MCMSRMLNSRKGKRVSGRSAPRRRGVDRRDFDHRKPDKGGFGRRDLFRNDSDKPSFEKGKGFHRKSFSRGKSDRGDVEMTKATCAACGARCEVPFRPTSDKPVYCRDCFNKKDSGSDRRQSSGPSKRDIEVINEKLDKIMDTLGIR